MNGDRFIDYNPIFKKPEEAGTSEEYKLKVDQELNDIFETTKKDAKRQDKFEKIIASATGFTIGDALGVPAEFKSREELKQSPITDMTEYGSHNMPKGTWSDDTSMTLATMDSIIELGTIDYDDIMKRFVKWYREGEYTATGEVFDVGITTKKSLDKYIRGYSYRKCGSDSFYDNGNGSLMRMLPLAIYFSLIDLPEQKKLEMIYYLSSLTHAHEVSLLGCRIYCDLFADLLDGKSIQEACLNLPQDKYDKAYDTSMAYYKNIFDGSILNLPEERVKSTGYIVDTLEAVVWCLGNSKNYEEAVLKAVNLGGDSDTIAAITGSLATVMYGYDSIPVKWEEDLKEDEMIYDKAYKFMSTILKIKDKDDLDAMTSPEIPEETKTSTR